MPNFVGSGWLKTFSNGGSVINIKIKKAEIEKLEPNEYGDIALVVAPRREPDEKSKATHYVKVDEYKRT